MACFACCPAETFLIDMLEPVVDAPGVEGREFRAEPGCEAAVAAALRASFANRASVGGRRGDRVREGKGGSLKSREGRWRENQEERGE